MAKKWIQGAIKHPGALRKSLHTPAGKPIPAAKLEKAAHKGGVMGRRARLAETLKGLGDKEGGESAKFKRSEKTAYTPPSERKRKK